LLKVDYISMDLIRLFVLLNSVKLFVESLSL